MIQDFIGNLHKLQIIIKLHDSTNTLMELDFLGLIKTAILKTNDHSKHLMGYATGLYKDH